MYDFIVIGAGQAGLSMAWHLKKAGLDFMVIDGDNEIGGSWLRRWDSIKLSSPAQHNHLPGLPFPAAKGVHVGKDQVVDYFKQYVSTFEIPLRLYCRATRMERIDDHFVLDTNQGQLKAQNVIVATGAFHTPDVPEYANDIDSEVLQLHSSEYKNPDQLQDGNTLVVGAGDAGAQILDELSALDKQVYFAGEVRPSWLPHRLFGHSLWWWAHSLGLMTASKYSWLGRKLSKIHLPARGVNLKKVLNKPNVTSFGRVTGAEGGRIQSGDISLKHVRNVIWATGFKPDFSWIKGLKVDEEGYPSNYRGVAPTQGLYFIGLEWMFSRGSATIGGVQKDAQFLIDHIITEYAQRNTDDSDWEPLRGL